MATVAEFRTEWIAWPGCIFDQKLCHVTVTVSGLPIRAVAACLPLQVIRIWMNHFSFSHTCPSWYLFTSNSPIRIQRSIFKCLMARPAVEESTYVCSSGAPCFPLSKLSRSLPYHLLLQHTQKYQSQIGLPMSMTESGATFEGLLKIIFKIDANVL